MLGIIGRVLSMAAVALLAMKENLTEDRMNQRAEKIMRIMEGRQLEADYYKEGKAESLVALLSLGYESYINPAITLLAAISVNVGPRGTVNVRTGHVTDNPKMVVDILNTLDIESEVVDDAHIRIRDYDTDTADKALMTLMNLKNRRKADMR